MALRSLSSKTAALLSTALFFFTTIWSTTTTACLWDYDTIEMEHRQFPGLHEIIAGHFLRHSNPFYEWRVKDRLQRLEKDPSQPELYDDLAVAYDKLGDHLKAIETMGRKEAIAPGLYETQANLGTFLIHQGNLEEGLTHIKKAIEINPDAHFGREIYQRYVVEYVLAAREDGHVGLPISKPNNAGFAGFLEKEREVGDGRTDWIATRDDAIAGVVGMLRFGNADSPVLLEVLGDLLSALAETDGKRLAARAYLKASYAVTDPKEQAAYRELAASAIVMQLTGGGSSEPVTLDDVEERFKEELAVANDWLAGVSADELEWIASAANPEEEFSRKYHSQEVVYSPPTSSGFSPSPLISGGVIVAMCCGLATIALMLVRKVRI